MKIAQGASIENARQVRKLPEFQKAIDEAFRDKGPSFITTKVEWEPKMPSSPLDGPKNKYRLIKYIEKTENLKLKYM